MSDIVPIQAVENPIICGPYDAPNKYWHYDKSTGEATKIAQRRPARYWYKTKDDVKGQLTLPTAEGEDDLYLVNQLREDVARWRESKYENATEITKELLRYWSNPDRPRRLFFCQLEAVETVIYLAEVLRSGKRPKFKPQFAVADLEKLIDASSDSSLIPLTRFGCKMATGSGKTVVMAMLIAWAFCNRGRNPVDERFPKAALVCCPNLTVKQRLSVLRPEDANNYYALFDIVPGKYQSYLKSGKVLVTNWHAFAPRSEHEENGKSYAIVNKGEESPEAFARDRLGELFDSMPIMVLNDEAHHCYRPKFAKIEATGEEAQRVKADIEEATVWIEGLDRINNATGKKPGVAMCIDLSATPFYLAGSGHAEGRPFPWLVSDFGLVDAIESGIVKIPRLPVSDVTGRPDPKYFKLWKWITDDLKPGERLPGKARKPKPEVIYREAEGALLQLAGQWKERFDYISASKPGQEQVPPVMIIVCDNVDIAEVFYRKISGESTAMELTQRDVEEVLDAEEADADESGDEGPSVAVNGKALRAKSLVAYGPSAVRPEFANTAQRKHTIRIDSRLLAEAESDEPGKSRQDAAEQLRQVVASVGKKGEPGEHVRCVVSVAMLTEGWDANNVTHILGVRAFGTQLLCEQVVGRGLRRMDYSVDKKSGLLAEEYVDVYGIPFSVIPYKGWATDKPAPEDRPVSWVRAMPERKELEIRFPVVEGFAYAFRRPAIKCDVKSIPQLVLEPNREPVATFLLPQVGYQEGRASQSSPFTFVKHDRQAYYRDTHLQTIEFNVTQLVVDRLVNESKSKNADRRQKVLALQSRHLLFPQVYRFVDEYVKTRVDWRDCNPSELGLQQYVDRLVERLSAAITPDESGGEPPLMPILNSTRPIGSSAGVDFKTTRPCVGTRKSHVNQVVLDTETWESAAVAQMESAACVLSYVRNDHLELSIPYEYQGEFHHYQPDFVVQLATDDRRVLVEVKGYETEQMRAAQAAAARWVESVNNWGELGRWQYHVCRDPQKLGEELAKRTQE